MPDWRGYVRQNLKLTRASTADEANAIEEIARQLEDAYLEALNRGLSPEEAAEDARLHITDWNELSQDLPSNLYREGRQHMSIVDSIESLVREARYAGRRLQRSVAFTVVAVLTLGLGIGANTVIY